MRKYETIIIVKPDLPEEELKAVSDKIQDTLTGMNADLRRLEDWGTRKLAYLIEKYSRGHYYYLRFDGDSKVVAELERRMRLDDRFLRYQTVKIEKEVEVTPVAEAPAEPEATEEAAAEEA